MSREKEQELRILILEDVPADAELIERELRKGGIQFSSRRVEKRRAFLEGLKGFSPHIVLGDYRLTSFDGLSAMAIVRENYPDISFIFISGSIGEDLAIETLIKGATDYVLKDRLSRLVPAINRALGEVEERIKRKRAEEALKTLYSRQQALLTALPDIVMEVDVNKVYTWANQPGYDFFGQDVIGKEANFYFEGEQSTYEAVQPLFDGGEDVIYLESWQRRRDGQKRLLAWWCKVLKDEEGNVTGALSSARDITERKRAEEVLRNEREKLELVTQSIGAGLAIISKDYRTLWANKVLKDLFGDVEGKICHLTYNQRNEICPECGVREIFEKGKDKVVHEQSGKDAHGNKISSEIIATPIKDEKGNITAALELVIPITERKQAEKCLLNEKQKFEILSENAPFGMVMIDQDGTFRYINPKFKELFGYDLDDVPNGKAWFRKAYPDPTYRHEAIADWINDLEVSRPGETRARTFTVTCKDGTEKIINFIPVQLGTGENLMTLEDITDRNRTEEVLRESERRYRLIAENMRDVVWTVDMNLRYNYISPSVSHVRGYSVEEAMTQTPEEIYTRESLQSAMKVLAEELSIEQREERDLFRSRTLELEVKCKDGSTFWSENRLTFLREASGQAIGILGVGRDITERKRMEEVLRESEQRLDNILQGSPIPAFVIGKDHKVIYWNKALEELSGIRAEEMVGTNQQWKAFYNENRPCLTDLLVDEEIDAIPQWYANKYKKSKLIERAYEATDFFPALGERGRWLRFTAAIVRNSEGNLIGALETLEDVTEQKRTEETLRQSEQRKTILNQIATIFLTIPDEEMYGEVLAVVLEAMKSKYGIFGYIGGSGELIIPSLTGEVWGECTVTGKSIVFPSDTWGESLWGRAIREKKAFYSDGPFGTPQGHVYIDNFLTVPIVFGKETIGLLSVANKEGGYNEEDKELQESIANFISPILNARLQRDRQERERKRAEESLQRSEEEAKRLAHENAVIAEIGRIISSTLNIEEVYKRFTEKVRELIPFNRIGITLIHKKEGKVSFPFIEGISVSGREPGDTAPLAGTSVEILFQERGGFFIEMEDENEVSIRVPGLLPEFRSGIRSALTVPLISGDEVMGGLGLRSVNDKAYSDHDLRVAQSIANQIAGAIANAQLFTKHERSEMERTALQEQLQQSQKMEAIGRLAGGIAHDFNNILTVIGGHCELSSLKLIEGDPLSGNIEEIRKASERAASLTRQLLAFSRRQILDFKVLNLNAILLDLNKMLRRVIGEDIELVAILAEDLGRVKTDPGQIEQVILNLAVNARDAMPNGGKLILETANVELDEGYARSHVAVKPGSYVRLSVSDTGVGMPPEVKEHIFEPFFTTKEMGKGTGLGLSTVYGIVKQSGGNIWVYSELGHGTVFKIYLPRVDEPVEVLGKREKEEVVPPGSETILLVEDEGTVREVAAKFLREQGYTVLEAQNGGDALLICMQHEGSIDLMLTDVVMPGISGRELADRLRSLHSEMKVLYMSGYIDNAIVHHGLLEEGVNYVQKPFSLAGLAKKVRVLLDKDSKVAS